MHCTKEQLKSDLRHFLTGTMPYDAEVPDDVPNTHPMTDQVLATFESVDYDLDLYMLNRVYEPLGEEAWPVLMEVCLFRVPPVEECRGDWLNGFLDLTEYHCDYKWNTRNEEWVNDYSTIERLRQLYFCDTYESFWMFVSCYGDIEALYKWYQGICPVPEMEDEEEGIKCCCKPMPEVVKRFEAFFDIKPETEPEEEPELELEPEPDPDPEPEPEVKSKRRALHFSIEGDEFDRWCVFANMHQHQESTGKIGDQFEFHFYTSGFGTISSVKCLVCGEEETLTDLDSL